MSAGINPTPTVAQSAQAIRLHALVLSRDPQTVRQISKALDDLGATSVPCQVSACAQPDLAVELLARARYDGVFVDCDTVAGAHDILKILRLAPSSSSAVSVAVSGSPMTDAQALDLGVNLVLQKPVCGPAAMHSLRIGHAVMLHERRHHQRHRVAVPAELSLGDMHEEPVLIRNISEGGLGIDADCPLTTGQVLTLRFDLPGGKHQVDCTAEIVWTRARAAGVKFLQMSALDRLYLRDWVAETYLALVKRSLQGALLGSTQAAPEWAAARAG